MLVTSIFSFSQNVFKSLLLQRSLKLGIVWLRVNPLPYDKIFRQVQIESVRRPQITIAVFDRVENMMEKGEIGGCKHFLL